MYNIMAHAAHGTEQTYDLKYSDITTIITSYN